MKLYQHTIASAAIAGGLHIGAGSWPLTVSALWWGIFIDLDHLIDYFRSHGLRAHPFGVFAASRNRDLAAVTLVFHGWEWVVLSGVLCALTDFNPWLAGTAIGLGQHLLFDQFTNDPHPMGYSFFWRMAHGFRVADAFPRPPRYGSGN